MKFFKFFFAFFLVLSFVILIPISCYVKGRERNLSTPLSRLVGHWDAGGIHFYFGEYFGELDGYIGSFVRVFPKFDMKEYIENTRKAVSKGEITEVQAKEAIEMAEKCNGLATYCLYKVIFQVPEGEKIEIEILWNDNDPDPTPRRVNFYIDKDGKQMKMGRIVPYVGEVISLMSLKYIDSKTSPEDK